MAGVLIAGAVAVNSGCHDAGLADRDHPKGWGHIRERGRTQRVNLSYGGIASTGAVTRSAGPLPWSRLG